MTSPAALAIPKSPPPPVSSDSAAAFSLTEPICCVVQLSHQAPGVIHQVVLDPAKIKDALIRLGDWPGDQAHGWQVIGNVAVLAVLGRATRSVDDQNRAVLTVTPIIERETGPDMVDG